MARGFSIGLLILLPLSLYLLYRKLAGSPTITNIPPNFQLLMEQAFQGSKYKKLLKYWLAVAKMETAGFSSQLYINANNPWGMKMPKQRKTTATGKAWGVSGRNDSSIWEKLFIPGAFIETLVSQRSDFARYSTLSDGVKDIILYMDALGYPENSPDLLSFIQLMKSKGYFAGEDVETYYNKVKAWLKR